DRQEVIKTRRAEVRSKAVRQTLVLAKDYSLQYGPPLSPDIASEGTSEPGVQPVGETRETSSVTDDAKAVASDHDVDSVMTQPGALVEPVLRPMWKAENPEHVQHSPLRRGAPERQLEEDRLVHSQRLEASRRRRDPQLVPASSRRAGDDEEEP